MIYAIGDIHGRYDLLGKALDAIRTHAGGDPERIVFLGDYIDRGPQSKEVVTTLIELSKLPYVTALKGNHEAMLISAFHERSRENIQFWVRNGGEQTIASYGGDYGWGKPSFWPLIPREHVEWMKQLPTIAHWRGRLFVHAGFFPNKPLEEQTEDVTTWIRDRFLYAGDAFKEWSHIVHGHTWDEDGKIDGLPHLLSWRTNLDSCAYASDLLSVAAFDGDEGGPSALLLIGPTDTRVVPAPDFDNFCESYLQSQ